MFACLYGQVHVVQWLLENEKLSKLLNVIDEVSGSKEICMKNELIFISKFNSGW